MFPAFSIGLFKERDPETYFKNQKTTDLGVPMRSKQGPIMSIGGPTAGPAGTSLAFLLRCVGNRSTGQHAPAGVSSSRRGARYQGALPLALPASQFATMACIARHTD